MPFLFKYAIDYLNASQPAMAAGQSAVLTSATALVLACATRPFPFICYRVLSAEKSLNVIRSDSDAIASSRVHSQTA